MKTIQFRELCEVEFDIRNIIIMNHYWQTGEEYVIDPNGRSDNGLMFLCDCDFEYVNESGEVVGRAERGSIVYSPIGSTYTCRFVVSESHNPSAPCDYLVNFLLQTESGEPFRLSDDRMLIRPRKSGYFCDKFRELTSFENRSFASRWKIKSLLYEQLGELSLELCDRDILTRRLAPLFPRSSISARPIFQSLTRPRSLNAVISAVPALRGSSANTPYAAARIYQPYEISQAKAKLASGLMSVGEVAESLGYSDASYFSRYYKKLTAKAQATILSGTDSFACAVSSYDR